MDIYIHICTFIYIYIYHAYIYIYIYMHRFHDLGLWEQEESRNPSPYNEDPTRIIMILIRV